MAECCSSLQTLPCKRALTCCYRTDGTCANQRAECFQGQVEAQAAMQESREFAAILNMRVANLTRQMDYKDALLKAQGETIAKIQTFSDDLWGSKKKAEERLAEREAEVRGLREMERLVQDAKEDVRRREERAVEAEANSVLLASRLEESVAATAEATALFEKELIAGVRMCVCVKERETCRCV